MGKWLSIVTKHEPTEHECVHHLIYGSLREKADKDGLLLPMSPAAHEQLHRTGVAGQLSKIAGQLAWEKEYYRMRIHRYDDADPAREAFRKEYGRSWL